MEITCFRVVLFSFWLVFVFDKVVIGTAGDIEFHSEIGGSDGVEIIFDDVELLKNIFIKDNNLKDEDNKHTANGDNGKINVFSVLRLLSFFTSILDKEISLFHISTFIVKFQIIF